MVKALVLLFSWCWIGGGFISIIGQKYCCCHAFVNIKVSSAVHKSILRRHVSHSASSPPLSLAVASPLAATTTSDGLIMMMDTTTDATATTQILPSLVVSILPDSVATTTTTTAAMTTTMTTYSEMMNYWMLGWQSTIHPNDPLSTAELSTMALMNAWYGTTLSSPGTTTLSILFLLMMCGLHGLAALYHVFSHPPKGYQMGYEPYARGQYDPHAARTYYQNHPWLVLRRANQILRLSYSFLWHWGLDTYLWKTEPLHRPQHAQALVELITRIGPTAIKIGQALSVRSDLLPQEYITALSTLQDKVEPFDTRLAQEVLRRELGLSKYQALVQVVEPMTIDPTNRTSSRGSSNPANASMPAPVASASIGQVYKVTLSDGRIVAVKIQRPSVLSEIALDLYLGREFGSILYHYFVPAVTIDDAKAIASEWGRGLIGELDYRDEAMNTIRFNIEMQHRQLDNVVIAPTVVLEYCTEQVLVTEWVVGTRIDQSAAQDIPRLCAVALNAYLVMLLETKTLHCDPHPGNLLRTPDGKLCILDFGMTLSLSPDLQYSLLEFVAHLTSGNYNSLAEDLVQLGFMSADKIEFVKRSGILEPMIYFMKQAGQGGGATNMKDRVLADYRSKYPDCYTDEQLTNALRVEFEQQMVELVQKESLAAGISMEIEELQRVHRDAFRMPDWFLYSSRAFMTLEGISLQSDPNYSLIKNCFPYIAKRLLADEDPRARRALQNMIYGATNTIDPKRLTQLADGFSSFTATSKHVKTEEPHRKLVDAKANISLAKDSADIVLSEKDNVVQNLLVQESTLVASAQIKDAVRETFVEGPQKLRAILPFGFLLPPLPFEDQVSPFVQKTEKEAKAQDLVNAVVKLLASQKSEEEFVKSLNRMDAEEVALIIQELRENLPQYLPRIARFSGKFLSTLLEIASESIDGTLQELEQKKQRQGRRLPPGLVQTTVQSLSSAAQQGATVIRVVNQRPTASSEEM